MISTKGLGQHAWDAVGAPFRMLLLPQDQVPRFGWTTLEQERIQAVLPHVRGRLLDIGAGPNTLVCTHGNGVGVDVQIAAPDVLAIERAHELPFDDASFDTAALLACLNYIPERARVMAEIARVLRPGGRLIITMINPVVGTIGHRLFWSRDNSAAAGGELGPDQGGVWPADLAALAATAGFSQRHHGRFAYAMNHLLVFELA